MSPSPPTKNHAIILQNHDDFFCCCPIRYSRRTNMSMFHFQCPHCHISNNNNIPWSGNICWFLDKELPDFNFCEILAKCHHHVASCSPQTESGNTNSFALPLKMNTKLHRKHKEIKNLPIFTLLCGLIFQWNTYSPSAPSFISQPQENSWHCQGFCPAATKKL